MGEGRGTGVEGADPKVRGELLQVGEGQEKEVWEGG